MSREPSTNVSDATRREAGLTNPELWRRYFGLGGMSTPVEVASYLQSGIVPDAHDHDVLAHALNERFADLGRDQVVAYEQQTPPREPSPRSASPSGVRLGLLGAFDVRTDAGVVDLPLSAQRLVCFLALHDGSLLREHVAGTLWPDTTEQRAWGSLRSALWRIRRAAGPLVDTRGKHLRILSSVSIDLSDSEALARRILDPSEDLSEEDLDDGLLAFELLPDWTEDWVLVRRGYHTQLRLRALEALCLRLCTLGRFGQAVQAGTLAVSGEPLRESAQRALIMAHLAEGNAAAAAKQYDTFRELLRDELGVEPSQETRALVQEQPR